MNPKLPHKQVAKACRGAVWIALVVAGCAAQGGCVHRRFTVRTNPPGARVFVDDYEIGTTPVSHDFVYYGTRKIRLVKDGYETLTILQPFPTPWWDLPGIDFISENLVPTEIRDHRVIDFQMQPQLIVPTEQLMGRADELRRSRNPTLVTPVGAQSAVPPGTIPPGAIPPGTFPPGSSVPGTPGATVPTLPPPPVVVPPVVVPPVVGPNSLGPNSVGPPVVIPPSGGSAPLGPPPSYQPRNFQPPNY